MASALRTTSSMVSPFSSTAWPTAMPVGISSLIRMAAQAAEAAAIYARAVSADALKKNAANSSPPTR